MISDYIYLNSKTFEIEENSDSIPVDKQLVKVISILNQKGYYTELASKARIINPFLIGSLIHSLIEQQLLNINDNTKNKIKKIINNMDCESTIITFKNRYKFNNLPHGYKLLNQNLFYNLEILKNNDNIEIKTLAELEKEFLDSIKILEIWANALPNNSKLFKNEDKTYTN